LNYRRGLWRRLTREWESLRWFERHSGESATERAAMQCLAELPLEQREAVVLKIWQHHTFDEIADLTGVSVNTAAGRYRYALQKLRVCLKGQSYERADAGEIIEFMESSPPLREA
jgi:RNA polymerase sigma-70 factor (ECF subfamily)